ncbi:ribosomal protein S18 acetylase RimI-like enzyme [Microterricola gilva]|uniref:Ribosomal protein S18 acetylase RimI-like enzyme n=1 Tax=Microterricola gilva TaxID=393267 RepID=A0A4Q8AHV9_9MICO|nr:GNAT family N-acetyltransferase [Microterricola gilva]RZU63938.1 ribosomal protein S18 acetylase RimI-like enzyme [Microterricola gilva]
MSPAAPIIGVEAPRQPQLIALLEQSSAYARSLGYPPESNFLLDVEDLEKTNVDVYVARDSSGAPLGIAALVLLDPQANGSSPGDAELKRMFVSDFARGQGVAGALLRRLESDARASGIRRIVLETGPLHAPALALYARHGYTEIAQFGQYIGERYSVCMAKPLDAVMPARTAVV